MSGRGWFRAYRKLFDPAHPIRKGKPLCPLAVWLDLVGQASHEPFTKDTGRHGLVELARGEFVASIRFLAKRWGWSKDATLRHLESLRSRDMLAPQRETPAGTVYLVVNYDFYNPMDKPVATPSATDARQKPRQDRDSNPDKEKKSKNQKNSKNREGARKRAHALPEDWKPNEQHAAYARKHRLNLEDEADSFRDHAEAKGRLLVSWDAGFRSWLKKAREFAAEKRGPRNVSPGSQAAAILSAPSDDIGKRRAEHEREAEQARVDAAVTRWEADHPAEAAALRTECGVDTAGLFEKGAARAAYKGRVLEQMDGAA